MKSFPKIFNKRNRVLLKELVKTDFKLRYQGSILGYLWALLRPLLMFAILYLVFTQIFNFGDSIPHYPVYLLTGVVLWNFFSECTMQGIQSIAARGDLIRKISFPKWIIVVSATSTALINLLINLLVVLLFSLINGVSFSFSWLLIVPLILEIYFLCLAISFILSLINVRFRDVASIWEVLLQAMFYAVPIIYPVSMIVERSQMAAKIFMMNPVAQVIQDARFALITKDAVTSWGLINNWYFSIFPIVFVLSILLISGFYFKFKSKTIAEEV